MADKHKQLLEEVMLTALENSQQTRLLPDSAFNRGQLTAYYEVLKSGKELAELMRIKFDDDRLNKL